MPVVVELINFLFDKTIKMLSEGEKREFWLNPKDNSKLKRK